MQFATHKTATPPLAGELIAQQTIICWLTYIILDDKNDSRNIYHQNGEL